MATRPRLGPWDVFAQRLDPVARQEDIHEWLDSTLSYMSLNRLPAGPFSEQDMLPILEAHPSLDPFYSAESLADIATHVYGLGAPLAVLANPSIVPGEYFQHFFHNTTDGADLLRLDRTAADLVFWKCNPLASSSDSLAWIVTSMDHLTSRGSLNGILFRWFMEISYYFTQAFDFHASVPLLHEAQCALGASRGREDDEKFASDINTEWHPMIGLLKRLISLRMKAGLDGLGALAAMIHELSGIDASLGGNGFPNLFDRVL